MVDLHTYRPRLQETTLKQFLKEFPVVILSGARQTGKTTLARSAEIGADREYRTMDEFSTLEVATRDPAALVAGAERMTLDEIQRAPQLLSAVKVEVDRDRRPGRFLCTGSANLLLMAQVSESLAGRAVYLDIPPLTWPEIERTPLAATLDAAIAATSAERFLKKSFRAFARRSGVSVSEAIFRGGFPVPSLSGDAAMRGRWFEGYAATYLERDLRMLSAIGDLVAFRRFMQAAALQNGALLNVAQLAQDAGIPPSTASRYLSLLEVSCLVWRVPAFTVNRGKRLSKTPKLFWQDSGLAAHLAGFQDSGQLAESRLSGAWLKSWVGHHLRTWASMRTPRPDISYWRTSAGHEVDFLVESARSLLPLEVKSTARPSGGDIRGLESFLDLHPEARMGILACACRQVHLLTSRIVAVLFEALLLG